jgi:hypothetical protein
LACAGNSLRGFGQTLILTASSHQKFEMGQVLGLVVNVLAVFTMMNELKMHGIEAGET